MRKCDLKALDEAIGVVEECLQKASTIRDTFNIADEIASLKPEAAKLLTRAKITKVEGTVMFIVRHHEKEPAQKRSKCEKQRNMLRSLEEGGQDLLHPKVREILKEALKFQ